MHSDAAPQVFFTFAEAAELIGGGMFPPSATDVILPRTISADSRLIVKGAAFAAVKGSKVDGHDYIVGALQNGAAAAIVEREHFDHNSDRLASMSLNHLIAPSGMSTEAALVKIADAWRRRVAPYVVGITGSVGKTSTREFLKTVLEGRRVHSAKKSYNTLIGCAMTIWEMPFDTEILILELGTNHPGEISEMIRKFPVDLAVITDAAPAHLEGLSSLEGVIAAKLEITESEDMQCLIYNSDNEALADAIAARSLNVKKIGVGSASSDIIVGPPKQHIDEDGTPMISFDLTRNAFALKCSAPLFGVHNAKNIAFAYAAASEIGVDDDTFVENIQKAAPAHGRSELIHASNGNMIIDDSYNANPASMSCAIDNVLSLELPSGWRRVAVLGGMRELGSSSEEWHRSISDKASGLDEVIYIGREWGSRMSYESCASFADSYRCDISNALVLIKGSRYYGLEGIISLFSKCAGR